MRRRNRIAFRLTAIYLVIALPLVAVTGLVYAQWYRTRVEIVTQERLGNARVLATAFELLVRDLQLTAGSVGQSQLSMPHGSAEARAELERFRRQWPLAHAVLVDPGGRVLSSSDPSVTGRDYSTSGAFRVANLSEDAGGVDPAAATYGAVVGFHVARRIDDQDGGIRGYVVGLVDIRRLADVIDVGGGPGDTTLIDAEGQVVFHSGDVRLALGLSDWGSRYGYVRSALMGRVGRLRGGRIAAFVPVERFGWAAGSSVSAASGLAPFYRSIGDTLLIAIVAVAASLLLAVGITRNVRRALTMLVEDAARLGAGELEKPVVAQQPDEIGEVATSLERARIELGEAQRRAAAELARTTILKEAATAAATLDARESSARVLDTLRRLFDVEAGAIYLIDHERRALTSFAMRGVAPGIAHAFEEVDLDDKSLSSLAVQRDDVVTGDIDTLPSVSRGRAELMGFETGVWLSAPIRVGREILGVMTLVFDKGRLVRDDDVAMLRSLADQLGVAVRNAQLYERERESARLGGVLASIDRVIHSSLRVDEVVKGALSAAAEAIGAESAAVDGLDEGIWVVLYDWGFDPSIVGRTYTDEQNPHGQYAIKTGETVAIDDAYTDPRVDQQTMRSHGLRSVIVAPLIVRGRPIAALYYNFMTPHRFRPAEIDFVSKVASSLSLAIENSRLYESEHHVSDTLQEALLTLPDEVPGITFAHAYHSAAAAAKVGGDFYDVFELDGGRLGITVGDIAGKGLDAAVLTSLVKNAVRAQATEPGKGPAEVMTVVNTVVLRSSPPEVFATVFFGILQRDTGELVYCNAGHTTGAVVCGAPGGTIDSLGTNSPFAGAFPDVRFSEARIVVGERDVVFLYTDGLTEARSPDGVLLGEQRLFEYLRTRVEHPLRSLVDGVVGMAVEWSGGELRDDLAILALRREISTARHGERATELGV